DDTEFRSEFAVGAGTAACEVVRCLPRAAPKELVRHMTALPALGKRFAESSDAKGKLQRTFFEVLSKRVHLCIRQPRSMPCRSIGNLQFAIGNLRVAPTHWTVFYAQARRYNPQMSERTLAIIKPDALQGGLAGKIIQRIEEAGFQIRAMRQRHLSKVQAEGFYAVHRE